MFMFMCFSVSVFQYMFSGVSGVVYLFLVCVFLHVHGYGTVNEASGRLRLHIGSVFGHKAQKLNGELTFRVRSC